MPVVVGVLTVAVPVGVDGSGVLVVVGVPVTEEEGPGQAHEAQGGRADRRGGLL